jgi:DNA-binding XRE family transcriptional regulator
MDLGGFVMENHLHVSAFHPIDAVKCPVCHLNQFNRDGKCGRCLSSLKVGYIELFLPSPLACCDSQGLLAIREELGRLIRRMRLRRGMTQTALASATATSISRTGLSRVENGRVLPSVMALIGIARALGIDKVTLRARSEAKTLPSSKRS